MGWTPLLAVMHLCLSTLDLWHRVTETIAKVLKIKIELLKVFIILISFKGHFDSFIAIYC